MSFRVRTVAILAFLLGSLQVGSVSAQYEYRAGYNPYTGYDSREAVARNPYTGREGATQTGYNPYTGTREQSKEVYNPYTGHAADVQRAYNPYTGRSAYHYSYRR